MSELDPYGTDLSLGPDGDLRVTPSGSLGAVQGPTNCAQAIFLRLKTALGDLPLHPDYGSQVETRIVGSKTSLTGMINEVNSELQTLLGTDPRFVSAQVVSAQQPATTGLGNSSLIGVQATLAGGETLTLGNVSDPAPSDVTLPQIIDPSLDPTVMYDPAVEQQFFADQPELDTLQDLNAQEFLVQNVNLPSSAS